MSTYFQKLTANQRVWGAIGFVIITGTVFKVSFSSDVASQADTDRDMGNKYIQKQHFVFGSHFLTLIEKLVFMAC
jgi:hypothetical protein